MLRRGAVIPGNNPAAAAHTCVKGASVKARLRMVGFEQWIKYRMRESVRRIVAPPGLAARVRALLRTFPKEEERKCDWRTK
ncbi:MAG: hypothetical protein JNK48_17630 [Bryobacterales bacterium]|nr:hypothetical protein [Bryobacterales bacterium]